MDCFIIVERRVEKMGECGRKCWSQEVICQDSGRCFKCFNHAVIFLVRRVSWVYSLGWFILCVQCISKARILCQVYLSIN